MKYSMDFMREGGRWLGELRSRIQTTFRNGDSVYWGSQDRVSHAPTVEELEGLGSVAVAGYHNEKVEPMINLLKECRSILRGQLAICREDDVEVVKKTINKLSMMIDNTPEWLLEHQKEKLDNSCT